MGSQARNHQNNSSCTLLLYGGICVPCVRNDHTRKQTSPSSERNVSLHNRMRRTYVERLPRLTRRTLAQLRTNKSPFLKSYLHKVDAKTHPSPLCPLCNNHTHDTHHLFNCTHIRTTLSPLDLWTDPARVTALLARWTEKMVGVPQAGTSDSPH